MEEKPLDYELLRHLERQENTSPRLAKLEPRFWQRLGEHLTSLRQAFQDQQEEDPTAHRTVVLADELRNTQRLAESIWALREKKVVHAALAAARRREGEKGAPDHASGEERDLFGATLRVLAAARDEAAITDPFGRRRRDARAAAAQPANGATKTEQGGAEPDRTAATRRQQGEGAAAEGPRGPAGAGERDGEGVRPEPEATREEAAVVEGRAGMGGAREEEMELRLVEALKPVPVFAGPDLVTYELEAGEVGSVPTNAATILAMKGLVRILPGT